VPYRLYESGEREPAKQPGASSVVIGTVTNNCDLVLQGKVQVYLPVLGDTVWARMATIGGGDGSGIWWVPRPDDEVIVALNQNDHTDAVILGGMYSTKNTPPEVNQTNAQVKRVIKTGMSKADGHKIELDDGLQAINIVSTTQQRITIDTKTIEVSNAAGTLTIRLDNDSQTVTVQGVKVKIEGASSLSMDAPKIDITSKGPISIASQTTCSISGKARVDIN
jgi:phage baseplate assembly protein V